VKAITICQPWASLIAVGAKRFETRSWDTDYRGQIAIHAGLKPFDKTLDEMFPRIEGVTAAEMEFIETVREYIDDDYFPYGAVVATAELIGCWKITAKDFGRGSMPCIDNLLIPSNQERLFGDWTVGRYAWELADVKALPEPVPARGHLKLWDWDGDAQ